jgi:hypothetical protein
MSTFKPIWQLLFGGTYLLSALLPLVSHLLCGAALHRLARALALPRPWLSWIPLAQLYVIGRIADLYTDNRLTTDGDRADPLYTPSTFRRKLPGFGIGRAITGNIASVCYAFCVVAGITFFFLALGGAMGGETEPPASGNLFLIAALVAFVAGVLWILLTILFLLSYCPALCRIFTALHITSPALLTALSVFFPPLCGILLFFSMRRVNDIAERFASPPDARQFFTESELPL